MNVTDFDRAYTHILCVYMEIASVPTKATLLH